jgi:hypothetical protein
MAPPNHPDNEPTPDPAGADTGAQGGAGGAGGEPKGARLQAQAQDRATPPPAPPKRQQRPEHSSDTSHPGYRARPAGQSGLGAQDDRTSAIQEPQGDGNYLATDRGDKPLRNG